MNKVENILDLYKTMVKLKEVPRQGWLSWCVEGRKIESIAEHTYGTICLAVAIFSNVKLELDFQKVITMLALHETEEIYIGDITPFELEKRKTKSQDGAIAVQKVFKNSENSSCFKQIIAEFEASESAEAIFAHQIDKLEADLQAMHYEGSFNLEKVGKSIISDERIAKLINNGYTKVSEFFTQFDKHLFDGITLEIAEYIEKEQAKN